MAFNCFLVRAECPALYNSCRGMGGLYGKLDQMIEKDPFQVEEIKEEIGNLCSKSWNVSPDQSFLSQYLFAPSSWTLGAPSQKTLSWLLQNMQYSPEQVGYVISVALESVANKYSDWRFCELFLNNVVEYQGGVCMKGTVSEIARHYWRCVFKDRSMPSDWKTGSATTNPDSRNGEV